MLAEHSFEVPLEHKAGVLVPNLFIIQKNGNFSPDFKLYYFMVCYRTVFFTKNLKSFWFHFLHVNFDSLSKSSFILDASDNFLLKQLSFCKKNAENVYFLQI